MQILVFLSESPNYVGITDEALAEPDVLSGRRRVLFLPLGRYEEVDPVLHDRAAKREAVLAALVLGKVGHVAREVGIASVVERGSSEAVGSALRDGVDQRAGEIALAHVERREEHLILLHRLEGNRLAASLSAGLAGTAQSEEVGLVGAVDLDAVEPVVDAPARDSAVLRRRDLRRQDDEVGEVAVKRRKPAERRVRHGGRDTGARRRERLVELAGHADGADLGCLTRETDVDAGCQAECHDDALANDWAEADAPDRDFV